MPHRDLIFPEGFLWGSAASAHQTEGGNHNTWSQWEEIPGKIKNGQKSGLACDHYNKYDTDFDLAKEFDHQVHRFSVEWSRIEPKKDTWNRNEIEHYRKVVQALIRRNIRPMITLHHFTDPIWFGEMNGWLNSQSPEFFAPYCRKVVEALSDFDIIWNTINEPMVVVAAGYLFGEFPPGMRDYNTALIAAKHLLMAHGQAMSQIREVYEEKGTEQPKIAPVISASYFMPHDENNEDDLELVQFLNNLYNHLWLEGAMNGTIPEPIGDGGKYEPLTHRPDFIGVNYYSRMVVSSKMDFLAGEMPEKDPKLDRCQGLDWEVYPSGYYPIIKEYWDRYGIPIFLTENGIGTEDDSLKRKYIASHLQQVHKAIEAGVDILGYLIWSLTDNFEWAQGFDSRFGLIEIDYSTQKRTPRKSAHMFKEIIECNGLSSNLQEKNLVG